MQQTIAKLFSIDGGQALRLSADFHFEGTTEVCIRRDETTGDLILSKRRPAD